MKTKFYLRLNQWSEDAGKYVTRYLDTQLYDIDDKDDRRKLLLDVYNHLVEGAEVKLLTKIDRTSMRLSSNDLFWANPSNGVPIKSLHISNTPGSFTK